MSPALTMAAAATIRASGMACTGDVLEGGRERGGSDSLSAEAAAKINRCTDR